MFRCSSRAQALAKTTSSRACKQGNYARFVFKLLVIHPSSISSLRKTFLFVVLAVSAAPGILSQRTKLERAKVSIVSLRCVWFLNWLLYSKGLVNKMYKVLNTTTTSSCGLQTGDMLQKKIRARPNRAQLIQRHILKGECDLSSLSCSVIITIMRVL